MNNSIYLRRRNRIAIEKGAGTAPLSLQLIATALKNLESLGYTFSGPLIEACLALSEGEFVSLYEQVFADLEEAKGAHRKHRPMYPNFPQQVMDLSLCDLYVNAIFHYWTDGQYFPPTIGKSRDPLTEQTRLKTIDLGTPSDFELLFVKIVSSNSSISRQDRDDMEWFIRFYGDEIYSLLPEKIPQKETIAHLAVLLLKHTSASGERIERFAKTATDVLRIAVASSDGDVSLAKPTRFRAFSRTERKQLLSLLESIPNPTEDMLRWKDRWIRLGERLHPGEYSRAFPKVAGAFDILRNNKPYETFNRGIERAFSEKDVDGALDKLSTRPGDMARRLDHLIRLDPTRQTTVLDKFSNVASKVSTPVLLQVREHFKARSARAPIRVFFPKGEVTKGQAIENDLPELSAETCARAVAVCDEALLRRFRDLPSLGKVYVDKRLENYLLPFSQRSASKSLRTLARGSKLPLPGNAKTIRFFIWWKNGRGRTDLDLSAVMFDGLYTYVDVLAYYNIKTFGAHHSGDIVDAPNGASEFIDVELAKLRERKVRYIMMVVTSFTQQPYCDLPECFAGWMSREQPNSGEVFEPKTVEDRMDLSSDMKIAVPLIIDLRKSEVIWCDLGLKSYPRAQNNVHTNLRGISLTLRAMVELSKPNLFDLLSLHAKARGQMVESPTGADIAFTVEDGIPFRLDEIASQYMA